MKKRGRITKEKKSNFLVYLFLRYLILLVFGVFLSLFYAILFPLTILPVYFLLSILYPVSIIGNVIYIYAIKIELINACIAGSAYYLLLILNLTTDMKAKQRVYSIAFSIVSLLILNILRIFFLSILYVESFSFFDITHKIFWYALSVILVVGVWFLAVKLFKIKNTPVYSDIRKLYSK